LLETKEAGLPSLLPKLQRYHRPASINEALDILKHAEGNALVLGGGVSLAMIPRRSVVTVVSTDRLGLDYVEVTNGTCRVGAGMTLGPLAEYLERMGGPAAALVRVGVTNTATTPLRNLMTVGGVIAGIGPWSDLPVAFLVLDAEVIINGEGSIGLDKLLEIGPGKVLSGKGIITEVRFRIDQWMSAAFAKLGRNATDLALASAAVACMTDNGKNGRIAVAVGGLVQKPVRVPAVERYLGEVTPEFIRREQLCELMKESVVPRKYREDSLSPERQ
jgi:CO/xanthine dehydrogenase FAD-binding subunit